MNRAIDNTVREAYLEQPHTVVFRYWSIGSNGELCPPLGSPQPWTQALHTAACSASMERRSKDCRDAACWCGLYGLVPDSGQVGGYFDVETGEIYGSSNNCVLGAVALQGDIVARSEQICCGSQALILGLLTPPRKQDIGWLHRRQLRKGIRSVAAAYGVPVYGNMTALREAVLSHPQQRSASFMEELQASTAV
jgi:hypothetical protein